MPNAIFAMLEALLRIGGGGCAFDIGEVSGYARCYFAIMVPAMIRRGWIAKASCHSEHWWITERGKIALAIETGRRTRVRALGRRYHAATATSFIEKRL